MTPQNLYINRRSTKLLDLITFFIIFLQTQILLYRFNVLVNKTYKCTDFDSQAFWSLLHPSYSSQNLNFQLVLEVFQKFVIHRQDGVQERKDLYHFYCKVHHGENEVFLEFLRKNKACWSLWWRRCVKKLFNRRRVVNRFLLVIAKC